MDAVLDYQVWLPPVDVQRNALLYLAVVDQAQTCRLVVEERADALVPAALNEAFSRLS